LRSILVVRVLHCGNESRIAGKLDWGMPGMPSMPRLDCCVTDVPRPRLDLEREHGRNLFLTE
jgi:hypothetical protein